MGWEGVEMKRGAEEKILEVPEVEDSGIFGQFQISSSSRSDDLLAHMSGKIAIKSLGRHQLQPETLTL